MAGGSFEFLSSSSGGGNVKSSTTSLSPSFGYFFSDNLAIGGSISASTSFSKASGAYLNSSSFGIGPFIRYYKYTANKDFAFFGQGELSYTSAKFDNTGGGETKTSAISFAVAPGFVYFLTGHWGIEFSVQLLSISSDDPDKNVDDNNISTIQFGITSFSPSIGFRYHFGN